MAKRSELIRKRNRRVLLFVVCLMAAAAMLAHEGESHQVLGSVERVRDCHFVVKAQNGETKTIFLSPSTRFQRGSQPAAKQDLASGARVVVTLEEDDETATLVKIGGGQ